MNQLSAFAQKVLDWMEPDRETQKKWIEKVPVDRHPQADCLDAFKARIEQAVLNKEKVLVAGDYDCDGVLAASIMTGGLKRAGLETGYYIPNRIKDGYGLHENIVQMAHDKGYSLIVTVDNGVSAHEALKKARELNVDVIVTDHHVIQDQPDACVVVHPSSLDERFESLCGAGVAYACICALHLDTDRELMYAATASIGDSMQVTGQTRSLIQEGLQLLNQTREPHLANLYMNGEYDESDLAFQIVPRINAPGRLCDIANPNNMVKYFLMEEPDRIARFAAQIDAVNEKRRRLADQTVMAARAQIHPFKNILLAADPGWHEGLIGLAAGNLTSQYGKPSIACTKTKAGWKCSMRSVKGVHCLDLLDGFDGYAAKGGHAMAAGFTVKKEAMDDFRRFIDKKSRKPLNIEAAQSEAMVLDPAEITVDNIQSLEALRPFGTGFEEPRFRIEDPQIVSTFDLKEGRHRKYLLQEGLEALHFNQSSSDMAQEPQSIRAFTGTLSLSRFQGRTKPCFLIDEIEYEN